MMDVVLYASILLVFRIISVWLIVDVIKKQMILRRRPIRDTKARQLREEMYRLVIVALLVNIVPILVDVLTIFNITTRPDVINPVSVLYMFSYAIGTLVITAIVWRIYRDALK